MDFVITETAVQKNNTIKDYDNIRQPTSS